ncbi:HEPN domain-containing protein [Methylophilus sp. TWE2]|uniref:HEPN domain-containing protein n=1 Tax=Methylophilus sp. TWE2 TaxID=1662285 RepID=UPI00067138FB|nr:HEPN domain-containing protein [Methylophilus sp. TWE2]
MSTIFGEALHAGLSGLEIAEHQLELGEGIVLRKTFAHMFAPFMLAFSPAEIGKPHPGPWKAARGGFGFDVTTELYIPADIETRFGSKIGVAKTILFLLRLGVNPATTLPVFANASFSSLASRLDNDVLLQPYEVESRHFPLGVVGGVATEAAATWVKERWQLAYKLIEHHADFALAVDALDSGQFVRHSALTLVSLWAALEALFSPSTSELKFRVSALIAAYLEAPGASRIAKQKAISKLYDKRSAAAHGKPTHEPQHLLESFNLLREVITKMLDDGYVPTKDQLEKLLFGA